MRRYRSLKTMKKRLIELVIERTFKFSAKPTFKLVSGNTKPGRDVSDRAAFI
jgi:hypothetical protein